jgi:hypothetical protein
VLGALPEENHRDFSLHPDGMRALASIGKFPWDIWMLEGFPAPE